MKPTARAMRLADYLEDELGWEAPPSPRECVKCGATSFNLYHKHCTECGKKLPDVSKNQDYLFVLEDAIKFALREE